MATAIKYFDGFEGGGKDGWYDPTKSPAVGAFLQPPYGTERYQCKFVPAAPAGNFGLTYLTPIDNAQVYSFYVYFSANAPDPNHKFFSVRTESGDEDFYLVCNTDNTVEVFDANGNSAGDWSEVMGFGGWLHVLIVHVRDNAGSGSLRCYRHSVGNYPYNEIGFGDEMFEDTTSDWKKNATDTTIGMKFWPQDNSGGVPAGPVTMYLNSYVLATGGGDTYGTFPYPYTTRCFIADEHTNVSHFGDDLVGGTFWDSLSCIPPTTTGGTLAIADQGWRACKGGRNAGPNGDGFADEADFWAWAWVYDGGVGTKSPGYGKCDDVDPPGNDVKTLWGSTIAGGGLVICVEAGTTYAPDADEYPLIGWESVGARGSGMVTGVVNCLHRARDRTRVHLKGATRVLGGKIAV